MNLVNTIVCSDWIFASPFWPPSIDLSFYPLLLCNRIISPIFISFSFSYCLFRALFFSLAVFNEWNGPDMCVCANIVQFALLDLRHWWHLNIESVNCGFGGHRSQICKMGKTDWSMDSPDFARIIWSFTFWWVHGGIFAIRRTLHIWIWHRIVWAIH